MLELKPMQSLLLIILFFALIAQEVNVNFDCAFTTQPNTLKVEAWAHWSARPKICFNDDNKLITKLIRDTYMRHSQTDKPQYPLSLIRKTGRCTRDQMQWHHLWSLEIDIYIKKKNER